jgi:hypothetical protein
MIGVEFVTDRKARAGQEAPRPIVHRPSHGLLPLGCGERRPRGLPQHHPRLIDEVWRLRASTTEAEAEGLD